MEYKDFEVRIENSQLKDFHIKITISDGCIDRIYSTYNAYSPSNSGIPFYWVEWISSGTSIQTGQISHFYLQEIYDYEKKSTHWREGDKPIGEVGMTISKLIDAINQDEVFGQMEFKKDSVSVAELDAMNRTKHFWHTEFKNGLSSVLEFLQENEGNYDSNNVHDITEEVIKFIKFKATEEKTVSGAELDTLEGDTSNTADINEQRGIYCLSSNTGETGVDVTVID